MEPKYKRTLYASYLGYITQAIVNNLAPLLFVIFQQTFTLSVSRIAFLVTFNFSVQILTDLLSAGVIDRVGYKPCIVAAHIFSAAGLLGLGILPGIMSHPYVGLLISIAVYAVGGGLIEVLVSPIVEALPTDGKSSRMSLLHSFYCWGHALVVILSTVFFWVAGTDAWRWLPILWAVIPACNAFLFAGAPVLTYGNKAERSGGSKLSQMKIFWLFVVLMICSGASEQAMSQWSSYFAETGLCVSKSMGDLLGPCMFAILMGASRWFYGIKGEKLPLEKFIIFSSMMCVASYLLTVFSPIPLVSLIGCGLCGLSVGIMWPGVFSLSVKHCPQASTAMFAMLALAGDVGCAGGPTVVGFVSQLFEGQVKLGLLAGIVFPMILIVGVFLLKGSIYRKQCISRVK